MIFGQDILSLSKVILFYAQKSKRYTKSILLKALKLAMGIYRICESENSQMLNM